MCRETISFFLVSALILLSMVPICLAQPRAVGVSEGDWFKFGELDISWESTNPNATVPSYVTEFNETEWILYSVVSVNGTNITIRAVDHFKNGTEIALDAWTDIETGVINLTFSGKLWPAVNLIIGANLKENDTIYTSDPHFINETITRVYASGSRETNHYNVTVENAYSFQYFSINYYWDRVCGFLVEISLKEVYEQDSYTINYSDSMKITESNRWVVPEFPSMLIMPLFMIATLLAVIVYRRKHTVGQI
jgi:hypothetical protein